MIDFAQKKFEKQKRTAGRRTSAVSSFDQAKPGAATGDIAPVEAA
jgi:hypothetical protein